MTAREIQRLKDARAAMTDARLAGAAAVLSVAPAALEVYGAGWDAETGSLSFPLYDGRRAPKGNVVAFGIRLIGLDGTDAGMAGGVPGLLVPDDYEQRTNLLDDGAAALLDVPDRRATVYVVPGGAAECAALRSLGLLAVGRCPAGLAAAGQMVRRLLVGEADAPKRAAVHVVAVAGPATDEPPLYPRGDGVAVYPALESTLAVCDALEPLQPEPVASLAFLVTPGPLLDWCRGRGEGAVSHDVTEGWLAAARRRLETKKAAGRRPPETD